MAYLYQQSKDDLEVELREQAEALRESEKNYDSGKLWEAKRLATTCYLLLHDGGRRSQSLLTQLGLKGDMLSTADHSAGAMLPLGIIKGNFADGPYVSFVARLDENSTVRGRMPFKKWYKEPIFSMGKFRVTRMNLICTMRHKGGGAHVDGEIDDEAFIWLKKSSPYYAKIGPPKVNGSDLKKLNNSVPDGFLTGEFEGPVPNAHNASMRQIAWEVDKKLQELGF